MKFIKHKDLCNIIQRIYDQPSWCLSDFEKLLCKFGDDWYVEGNEWECVEENKTMKTLRQKWEVENDT